MTTLYYLDSDQVKLTHYCMAGNQPTMRGTYAPETKTITFDLVSISNLKSAMTVICITRCTRLSTTIISRPLGHSQRTERCFTEDVTYVRK